MQVPLPSTFFLARFKAAQIRRGVAWPWRLLAALLLPVVVCYIGCCWFVWHIMIENDIPNISLLFYFVYLDKLIVTILSDLVDDPTSVLSTFTAARCSSCFLGVKRTNWIRDGLGWVGCRWNNDRLSLTIVIIFENTMLTRIICCNVQPRIFKFTGMSHMLYVCVSCGEKFKEKSWVVFNATFIFISYFYTAHLLLYMLQTLTASFRFTKYKLFFKSIFLWNRVI